jgi:signal peptidase I
MNPFRLLIISYTLFKDVLILAILLALYHSLIGTIFVVSGESMDHSLQSGQYLYINKISYLLKEPQRGDIVVLRFPGDPDNKKLVKRLIGLPGEKVEIDNNRVFIDDKELIESYLSDSLTDDPDLKKQFQLEADDYLLLGDNRIYSYDSRIWGPAHKKNFIGKASFILYPFEDFGVILRPAY